MNPETITSNISPRTDNVCFTYGKRIAIDRVNITAAPGKLTVLLGPNGSGKSTLLRLLAGIIQPSRGTIYLGDCPLFDYPPMERAKLLAYVPQHPPTLAWLTVRDLVALGRLPYQHGLGWENRSDVGAINEAMQAMNLVSMATRSLQTLSGGELQRALIARALAQSTRWLLLDEPVAHLDIGYQEDLLRLLKQLLLTKGIGIICAMHDLNLCLRHADQAILLRHGSLVASGIPRAVMTAEKLGKIFNTELEWKLTIQPSESPQLGQSTLNRTNL